MIDVSRIDAFDEDAFDAWFEVLRATDLERYPDKPGWQRAERLAWAQEQEGPEEHRCLVARHGDGPVLGIADLELFHRENQHLARVDVRVLPEARRQGTGTALVEAASAMAVDCGRRELGGMDESPTRAGYVDRSESFARALGFHVTQQMARRELSVPLPPEQLAAWEASARGRPPGYTMLTFHDRWPDAFMADRCEFGRRMSTDAPLGDQELDEEVWDEARVRKIEEVLAAMGRAKVTTAARHDVSGRLVGFTEIAVPLGAPESSWQHDTLVLREHRGHGLGFAMKLANLGEVLKAHPRVRSVNTWNAVENEPMIAVNEEMGFELVAISRCWLKKL